MPNVMHLLKIKAAPERVYQALTTPKGTTAGRREQPDREHPKKMNGTPLRIFRRNKRWTR